MRFFDLVSLRRSLVTALIIGAPLVLTACPPSQEQAPEEPAAKTEEAPAPEAPAAAPAAEAPAEEKAADAGAAQEEGTTDGAEGTEAAPAEGEQKPEEAAPATK